MTNTYVLNKNISFKNMSFSPEVMEWASRWFTSEQDYLMHRLQFGNEPVRSICKLILQLCDNAEICGSMTWK